MKNVFVEETHTVYFQTDQNLPVNKVQIFMEGDVYLTLCENTLVPQYYWYIRTGKPNFWSIRGPIHNNKLCQ